jgi:hypothetical protein
MGIVSAWLSTPLRPGVESAWHWLGREEYSGMRHKHSVSGRECGLQGAESSVGYVSSRLLPVVVKFADRLGGSGHQEIRLDLD